MTAQEIIEKIRAEVNRLKPRIRKICGKEVKIPVEKVREKFDTLLSFLSVLEKECEKPTTADGLERAVVDYFEGYWPGMETAEQCNTDLHFTPPAIMRLARHFYELGCRRTAEKYDEIEYKRQRADVCEGLEEEIERYIPTSLAIKFPTTDIETIKSDIRYIARHFAQWQKEQKVCEECPNRGNTHSYLKGLEDGKKEMREQMMSEAVEGVVVSELGAVSLPRCVYEKYDGQKVKLIILPKEDKK